MINFLFNGSWGFMPKFAFWLLAGWIICSIIEWGGNDGKIATVSLVIGGIGTILAAYSLYLSVKSER